MRFAVRLSYNGNAYSGWQTQNNAPTIQKTIEDAIAKRYQNKIPILGCCRTDKGVHASDFVMHFDYDKDIRENFIYYLNKMLPNDISLNSIVITNNDFHARFDAIHRSYIYKVHTFKNPFKTGQSYYFPTILNADFNLMQKAVHLLMEYNEFFPFCKTNTDVKTMNCDLKESNWVYDKNNFYFNIRSDRFLRGMVRMIVGMSINVGLGKISLNEVKGAMDNQLRMRLDWSVPAHGLYLNEVKYLTLD